MKTGWESLWSTNDNLVLLNPRMPRNNAIALRALLETAPDAESLRRHIFLLTSGTSARDADPLSGFKWVALSETAVLSAAESANRHLESDPSTNGSKDIWLHCLPDFHVGGLAIWARSALSGARVVRSECALAWNPALFVSEVHESRATLCSLVPTQLHDLVSGSHRAPASLRVILLGGGAASTHLVSRARALGWPILPTYGMSEACSQVATTALHGARDPDPTGALQMLEHLEASSDSDQRLRIRGSSLLSGYVVSDAGGRGVFVDPKQDGWFITEDFGKSEGRSLTVLGRISERVKIGGETVHLGRLEALLEEEASRLEIASQLTLIASPDERLESVIHAVREQRCDPERVRSAVARYNLRVLPFERIRSVRSVPAIPRTDLGKIRRAELNALLSQEGATSPSP